MNQKEIEIFRKRIWDYYHNHKRNEMPWRNTTDPYHILVSEIMLQQTQVNRVTDKYHAFITTFPTIESLANAKLSHVLSVWQGLGYNRRAQYLKSAAEKIQKEYHGIFPQTVSELVTLPGIGHATAGAMMAYAFNKGIPYIETNIRSIYIHHFFKNKKNIPDTHIYKLVEQTMDTHNPREWYWALMDYGTALKKEVGNTAQKSKSYQKQSRFEGSFRQKRGLILKFLLQKKRATEKNLLKESHLTNTELQQVLQNLRKENLITKKKNVYQAAD